MDTTLANPSNFAYLAAGLMGGLLTLFGTLLIVYVSADANEVQRSANGLQARTVAAEEFETTISLIKERNTFLEEQNNVYQRKLADLQDQVSGLKEDQRKTREERYEDLKRRDGLQDQVRKLEQKYEGVARENERLKRENERLQSRVDQLEDQLDRS